MTHRLDITMTVQADSVALDQLRYALADERGCIWLRAALSGALERLLYWVTRSKSWQVRVIGGTVGEIVEIEKEHA